MAPGINPAKGQGISSRHGRGSNGGAQVLYGDGRVDFVSQSADAKAIHSRLSVDDGTLEFRE